MNLRAEGGTDIRAALMAGIDASLNVEMSSIFSDVIMARSWCRSNSQINVEYGAHDDIPLRWKSGKYGGNPRERDCEKSTSANSNFLDCLWKRGRFSVPPPDLWDEQRFCEEGIRGQRCNSAGLKSFNWNVSSFYMELEKIHKEKDICNIAKIHVEKSLTRCNIVQLEKFYSELSQPVASDIDFE